ncbi:MAG: sulfatase-like hydrolase/transferase [Arachidicoccus sp.]|nr:sulfatase-like hydrolase/transferase [Arachidicoccus sp.]
MNRIKIPRYIHWLFILALIFLVLMTLLRIAALIAFPKPDSDVIHYEAILWMGFRFDCRDVAIGCLLIFLISLIKPLNPFETKLGKYVAFTLWTLMIIFMIVFYVADFGHYSYLDTRLSATAMDYLKDTKTSLGMIWETYPVFRVVLGIAAGIFGLNWIVRKTYHCIKNKKISVTKQARIASPVAFLLLSALAIFGRVGQFPLRWSDAFTLGSDYASNMALNPFQSFFSSIKYSNLTFYDLKKVKKYYTPWMTDFLDIKNIDTAKLNYTRVVKPESGSAAKPNIVIVLCESFSYLKSSMSGNKLNPTPYFDSLSKQGVLFTRAFSPSYGTARGVWALLTGEPDTDPKNTTSRNPNAVNQHLIFDDFAGYDKYYFLGGSLSWANVRGVLENNIPDLKTYEQDDYDGPKINVWGVSDKDVFNKANEVFSKENKPFVAIVQTADNHRPYTIPEEDKKNFHLINVPDEVLKQNGYTSLPELNSFRYTDFCFRNFIESARKEKYFNNTIFVFVGDHGIKGDPSRYYSKAWSDGGLVFMHVPLLFYSPALLKPEQINTYASQTDIFPTVAGLAKINYTNTTLGRDLFSPEFYKNANNAAAFIYNPMMGAIGIVKDSLFYSMGIYGQIPDQFWNMNSNDSISLSDSTKNYYRNLVQGIFNTGRYMMLNNKRR